MSGQTQIGDRGSGQTQIGDRGSGQTQIGDRGSGQTQIGDRGSGVAFLSGAVSRETRLRLETHAALLRQWQARINLVAASTLPNLWERHFSDSAQLCALIPKGTTRIADMGSGAGFPGLVLAILTGIETHLIESDQRKCAFLREAARQTQAPVILHSRRLETMPALGADLITARALAPLPRLLAHARRLGGATRWRGLFLKGETWRREIETARRSFRFTLAPIPSQTQDSAMILSIEEVDDAA